MSVVTVNNISKSYFSENILDHVSFSLEAGDKLALIGENGSGKTTLMRIIAGETEADEGSVKIAADTVISYLSQQMEEFTDLSMPVLSNEKLDAAEKKMQEAAAALARGEGDPEELLARYQARSEAFENAGGYLYPARLAKALAALGIKGEMLHRPIASLSGGERMRVLTARRLLEKADLLLLDEPTNHLDIEGLEWLEDYLQNFKGTVIFISHDRYFIEKTATRTAELAGGKLYQYKGAYNAYKEQKAARIEAQQLTLERLEKEHERQSEVKQTMLSHRKMTAYHSREKVVAKLEDKIKEAEEQLIPGEKKLNFHFTPKQDKRDPERLLLKLEDAEMAFPPQPPLFSGLNLEMKATDKKVLAGPNGCGKSTVLGMITGRIQRFKGELFVAPDLRFGHLGQYTEFPDETKTVFDELSERTLLPEAEARTLLARYGFTGNDVFKEISVLSGGERARLYLCLLLEEEPDILFLDEPTNHLDIHSREILEDAILDFNGAVLAVSHDRYFIEKCQFTVKGFINGGLRSYASYESYRHFARLAEAEAREEEMKEDAVPKAPAPSGKKRKSETAGLGRLQKEEKALRRSLRAKEKQTEKLEKELAALESELGTDDHSVYQDYADLQNTLETLYEAFFEEGERLEEVRAEIEALI